MTVYVTLICVEPLFSFDRKMDKKRRKLKTRTVFVADCNVLIKNAAVYFTYEVYIKCFSSDDGQYPVCDAVCAAYVLNPEHAGGFSEMLAIAFKTTCRQG
jgi:hypothetical protein